MLSKEETDDWVVGSYNQHSTYFGVMNHHFYPSHTVLVHSLRRKPHLWMGLMAGQLLVEPCQETLDKPKDLMVKVVQYCSSSFVSHTPSLGIWDYLPGDLQKFIYSFFHGQGKQD